MYSTHLREYHRSKHESQLRTVSVRDVVIVHKGNVKRGLWKIGKVDEAIRRTDCMAKVKVTTSGKPGECGKVIMEDRESR